MEFFRTKLHSHIMLNSCMIWCGCFFITPLAEKHVITSTHTHIFTLHYHTRTHLMPQPVGMNVLVPFVPMKCARVPCACVCVFIWKHSRCSSGFHFCFSSIYMRCEPSELHCSLHFWLSLVLRCFFDSLVFSGRLGWSFRFGLILCRVLHTRTHEHKYSLNMSRLQSSIYIAEADFNAFVACCDSLMKYHRIISFCSLQNICVLHSTPAFERKNAKR